MRIPQNIKNVSTLWSSDTAPGHIPEGIGVSTPHIYLSNHIDCSTVHSTKTCSSQSRCVSTDKWTKNCEIDRHTVQFYSSIKNTIFMSFPGKWVKLEIILPSSISQTQNSKQHVFFSQVSSRFKNILKIHVWRTIIKTLEVPVQSMRKLELEEAGGAGIHSISRMLFRTRRHSKL